MLRKWLLAVVPLLAVSTVQAGLVPINVTISPEGDSNNYRFCYSVTLESQSVLQPGDYFTIYDFAGRIQGTELQPANFTFSSSKVGPTPDQINPNDDPNIDNITWTYTGEALINGERYLGEFCLTSTFDTTRKDDFSGQVNTPDGKFNNNITCTDVPTPAVPEPSAWMLGGFGLIAAVGLGLYRRRTGLHAAV